MITNIQSELLASYKLLSSLEEKGFFQNSLISLNTKEKTTDKLINKLCLCICEFDKLPPSSEKNRLLISIQSCGSALWSYVSTSNAKLRKKLIKTEKSRQLMQFVNRNHLLIPQAQITSSSQQRPTPSSQSRTTPIPQPETIPNPQPRTIPNNDTIINMPLPPLNVQLNNTNEPAITTVFRKDFWIEKVPAEFKEYMKDDDWADRPWYEKTWFMLSRLILLPVVALSAGMEKLLIDIFSSIFYALRHPSAFNPSSEEISDEDNNLSLIQRIIKEIGKFTNGVIQGLLNIRQLLHPTAIESILKAPFKILKSTVVFAISGDERLSNFKNFFVNIFDNVWANTTSSFNEDPAGFFGFIMGNILYMVIVFKLTTNSAPNPNDYPPNGGLLQQTQIEALNNGELTLPAVNDAADVIIGVDLTDEYIQSARGLAQKSAKSGSSHGRKVHAALSEETHSIGRSFKHPRGSFSRAGEELGEVINRQGFSGSYSSAHLGDQVLVAPPVKIVSPVTTGIETAQGVTASLQTLSPATTSVQAATAINDALREISPTLYQPLLSSQENLPLRSILKNLVNPQNNLTRSPLGNNKIIEFITSATTQADAVISEMKNAAKLLRKSLQEIPIHSEKYEKTSSELKILEDLWQGNEPETYMHYKNKINAMEQRFYSKQAKKAVSILNELIELCDLEQDAGFKLILTQELQQITVKYPSANFNQSNVTPFWSMPSSSSTSTSKDAQTYAENDKVQQELHQGPAC